GHGERALRAELLAVPDHWQCRTSRGKRTDAAKKRWGTSALWSEINVNNPAQADRNAPCQADHAHDGQRRANPMWAKCELLRGILRARAAPPCGSGSMARAERTSCLTLHRRCKTREPAP